MSADANSEATRIGPMSVGPVSAEASIATGLRTGDDVLLALAELPGGGELTRLGREHSDLALVGGAVRDLLLGQRPRELDVVLGGAADALAAELAALLSAGDGVTAQATAHERFGTAVLDWGGARVDIATRRAESYASPGALPQVRAGSVEDDLARRDFTVNAIAVALGGPRRGELLTVPDALDDLAAGRLRVLHERSFLDDPTRLLRLARYSARLGFQPEPHTAALAAAALAAGALRTVSSARVGAELRLALTEANAVGTLAALDDLGVLSALDPRIRFDGALARAALALLPDDGRPDLLLMASLLLAIVREDEDAEAVVYALLDGLEFTASERERVMRCALVAPALDEDMRAAELPSQLRHALCAHTVEAVALAAAIGGSAAQAQRWLQQLRHVRLEIGGDDLLAAGVPAGPQIGRRLARTLALKLDGELQEGRAAELRAALEGAS